MSDHAEGLKEDSQICTLWQSQTDTINDVIVMNTDVNSKISHFLKNVLKRNKMSRIRNTPCSVWSNGKTLPHLWYQSMNSLDTNPKSSSRNLLVISPQSGNNHPTKLITMFRLT